MKQLNKVFLALLVVTSFLFYNGIVTALESGFSRNIQSYGIINYQPPTPGQLFGCTKIGHEYVNPTQELRREVDPAFHTFDAQQIASWGANFVRVPFNSYWYNNDPQYRAYIRQWVDACAKTGIYTVMDLHSFGSPPIQGGSVSGWTEEECWSLFNSELLPCLEQVARDYLNQPYMIGVEINEFWMMAQDASAMWIFTMNMGNTLAQNIHVINPHLLVFIDTYGEWATDEVIRNSVNLITEPNIIFAPHFYCAETSTLTLHPTRPIKYGEDEGYDFYYAYAAGNLTEGKTKMYHWLDLYHKAVQDLYHVPFVITEFATSSQPNIVQALEDMVQYFKAQNWGFAYFAYYGRDDPSIHLLKGDWTTLQPQGEVFVATLNPESS